MKISPKQNDADWYRWMEGMQDWCISRQLWWGHRCPAYLVCIEGGKPDVRFCLSLCQRLALALL